MAKMQKLELTWAGKNARSHPEPRILMEDKSRAYGDPDSTNMLIHGDNLLALKSLEADFAGQVKCIYIDPPYNTGNAWENYDDGVEHSIWLSLIRDRLEILRTLLADDGCIFVQINDDEYPYLKILMDEVFGRQNYETTFYVKVRHENRILREDIRYQLVIEQVLIYRKTDKFIAPRREKIKDANVDYIWDVEIIGEPSSVENINGYDVEIYKPNAYKIIKSDNGNLKQYQIRGSLITQSGSASEYYEQNLRERREKDGLGCLYKVIGMGINGDGLGYRYIMQPTKPDSKNGFYFQGKPKKATKNKGLPYPNFYDLVDAFNNAGYEGGNEFRGGKKPEEFIRFLLNLVTSPGDLVLDSFLGSGTTAAVAHKMGRRWIGIELGDHAYTHCQTRLQKVVDGTDTGGISKAVNWTGGGGFKFYELAPSLLVKDEMGNLVIAKEYNADMLAEAMCKLMGYKYAPDKNTFWKQGKGTENNYIFTTTMVMTAPYLEEIARTLGNDSLMICCSAFIGDASVFPNITIKRIPKVVLDKCEWNKPGYPLPVREDFVDEDFEFGD
ncbi:MAG TPA: site-specific DNA-methyltransferase [Candidatus Enterousia intestinigallinarum]|uniref:site-specific DNA-methyltransferase (adenine-specific) n=1 Tax=Candidatus Enterousia intestinigallinarum TaxID=2840790 RepID=A0A9D1FFX0_9PROT|nr:site-specific DNA-methyltransferase [Candidatus Enterousia intestinigallinarum]